MAGDSYRFDYDNQAWIVNEKYARCNHPEAMNCVCYGRLHAGEAAPPSQTGPDGLFPAYV